jgi:hypothetical protein
VFDCDGMTLYFGTDRIGTGYLSDDFMVQDTVNSLSVDDSDSFMINSVNDDSMLWHAKLCHVRQ